ncbi:hypothetical protein V2J09_017131 [Rumex salicifolius]
MNPKPFKGANVFMSRNLVPPEIFDSLHYALKLNGAEVVLCCDPSRNSSNDYHVISSSDHEKFEGLRAKGCNLVGPQCVLACAKERRALPNEGYTCCLAMDGVKVLISGFEMEERAKFGKLVAAMGGSLLTKPSSDVSFVVVKNVIAAKYKWAIHIKKPVLTINWLYQCWNEHRIVPQESYRCPTFSGLIICVTRILGAPEGDKYKVAKKWGHIHIVTRKWLDQSIAKRACLAEESYPVHRGSVSSTTVTRGSYLANNNFEKSIENSQSTQTSRVPESDMQAVPSSGNVDLELDTSLSQHLPVKGEECEAPQLQPEPDMKFDDCVAKDSDDDDLYLSNCKICLVGFDALDVRKFVNMIRKGGGSRYTSYSERMTHVIVGSPSDKERKELRGLAAVGVTHVVQPNWLEDCERAKREISVMQRHMANDVLLPKGSSHKGSIVGKNSIKPEKVIPSSISADPPLKVLRSGNATLLEQGRVQAADVNIKGGLVLGDNLISSQHSLPIVTDKVESQKKIQPTCSLKVVPGGRSSGIFMGKLFSFTNSFPQDRREEVVEWLNEGGGIVVDHPLKANVDYTVECHGVSPQSSSLLQTTFVSSHWVRACLEVGVLLDVASHMLYSPLPCRIPFPGYERYRFCVSQYDDKDRLLLRNLCFVLGVKYVEKLTKRVTHLICKFSSGPKYEACPKWGIEPVTCEWIYECIKQDKVVALDSFRPKEPSDRDLRAGLCTLSQYPSQAVQVLSGDSSQRSTQSLTLKPVTENTKMLGNSSRKEDEATMLPRKKTRLFGEVNSADGLGLLSGSDKVVSPSLSSRGGNTQLYPKENSQAVPDVAAAIEDLLEQTTKIHDMSTPGETENHNNIFSSDHATLGTDPADSHIEFGPSTHWLSRVEKQDEPRKPPKDRNLGFTETQTESQLVGYEEDLSGRQMIIERVRTRKSTIDEERAMRNAVK